MDNMENDNITIEYSVDNNGTENNEVENKSKKLRKRNVVFFISVLVIALCVTFRTSYSFYVANVVNTHNPTPTVIQSGDLELKFGNNIRYLNVQDLSLMSAEDAATASNNYSTFTVTNTGTLTGKYRLYLSNYSITTNLVNEDFKYKLTIDGNTYTGTFYDLFNGKTATEGVIADNLVDIPLLTNDITLAPNATHNCELRVWIQEADRNQIDLTEGTFRTSIRLVAINE